MFGFVVRLIRNLLALLIWPLWAAVGWLARPKGNWVVIRLRPKLVEMRRTERGWRRWLRASAAQTTSLHEIRKLVQLVQADPGIEGVAIVMPKLRAGWTVCAGLRDAIVTLRDADKATAVLLLHSAGNKELYIASASQRVFTIPHAAWMPLGLSIRTQYVRPLLRRLGVEVEPFARAEYKTAVERFSRDEMSAAQREQHTAILQEHHDALLDAVSERFGGDRDQAQEIFEQGYWSAEEAVGVGLADGVGYEDELATMLGVEKTAGGHKTAGALASGKGSVRGRRRRSPFVESERYLRHCQRRLFTPWRREPYLAVVAVQGAIGESGSSHGRREALVAALRTVRRDQKAKGLLLWVDSPGGSAEASDLIHREVERVRQDKPVVAYFGDVAASGGYYVAACSHEIVAHPLTLTGSIGVVSARVVASSLLEKLGARTEVLRTTAHADMFSPHRELSESERTMINRQLDAFYRAFVDVVANGRQRNANDVEPLARGRVWTGRAAHRHGLVDHLGGMADAIRRLRAAVAAGASKPSHPERLSLRWVQMQAWAGPPPPVGALLGRAHSADAISWAWAASRDGSPWYHAFEMPRVE